MVEGVIHAVPLLVVGETANQGLELSFVLELLRVVAPLPLLDVRDVLLGGLCVGNTLTFAFLLLLPAILFGFFVLTFSRIKLQFFF